MDKVVRVNFFQVSNVRGADETLFQSIVDIDQLPDKANYTQVSNGVNIRIERVLNDQGFLSGDLVRQQTDNLPPIAHASQPLAPNTNPLGHRSAFRYHPATRIIAIEANRLGASPARLNQFIRRKMGDHRGFFFDPCLNADALAQLRDGTPRQLQLRVACPTDLNEMAGNPYDIEGNLSQLQEMVNGNIVTVEIGFGRGDRDSSLNIANISEIARWAFGNRHSVKKLSVKTLEDDIPIDLFGQHIFERETLELDTDNLDEAYRVRALFLSECFDNRWGELAALYGDQS